MSATPSPDFPDSFSKPHVAVDCYPATVDALETLSAFILAMAAESENIAVNPETLNAGIKAVFNNPALGTYWLIAQESHPVGCALVTTEWSDWNNAPYWWIQSLYLTPAVRGQGLFEQFLEVLNDAALVQNVQELRLYVATENMRAIRVYERNRFEGAHYRCMTRKIQ